MAVPEAIELAQILFRKFMVKCCGRREKVHVQDGAKTLAPKTLHAMSSGKELHGGVPSAVDTMGPFVTPRAHATQPSSTGSGFEMR